LGLITVFLGFVFFYWIKILKDIAKITSDLKETGRILKEKTERISGVLAGIISFIENFSKAYFKRKKKDSKKSKKH